MRGDDQRYAQVVDQPDEPTASLDPITAKKVMALFVGLVNDLGITLIVASHDWPQIEALGLRQLTHSSHFNAAENLSESRFADAACATPG